jgi:hypothetical protein
MKAIRSGLTVVKMIENSLKKPYIVLDYRELLGFAGQIWPLGRYKAPSSTINASVVYRAHLKG